MEEEVTQRDSTQLPGGLGELPDDLRVVGPHSIPGIPDIFEGDGYSFKGGANRPNLEPIPNLQTEMKVVGINYLPRANYPSFRSQRIFQFGRATLAPSSGNTFSTLASFEIPDGFAAVITGLGQWIGDPTAYQKPNGDEDDVRWRITVAGSGVFDYSNFQVVISSLTQEAKLFFVAGEGITVELSASNDQPVGSMGSSDIPVAGYLTGHQFPIDELDDIFRNR